MSFAKFGAYSFTYSSNFFGNEFFLLGFQWHKFKLQWFWLLFFNFCFIYWVGDCGWVQAHPYRIWEFLSGCETTYKHLALLKLSPSCWILKHFSSVSYVQDYIILWTLLWSVLVNWLHSVVLFCYKCPLISYIFYFSTKFFCLSLSRVSTLFAVTFF